MKRKERKNTIRVVVMALLMAMPVVAMAQQKAIGGVMRGREIEIVLGRGAKIRYVLNEARLRDGKLELGGRIGVRSFAGLVVGTTARATNPIPRATDAAAPRRETRPAGAAGERNEQTQSLYAATETGTGCELIFMKMSPGFAAPQLGIVLAHLDNPLGEKINQGICRIRRGLEAGSDVTAAVESLDKLLKQ